MSSENNGLQLVIPALLLSAILLMLLPAPVLSGVHPGDNGLIGHGVDMAPILGNPWNTFLGAAGSDCGYDIAVDEEGNVYITGSSTASWGGIPVRNYTSGADAYVAKLDSYGVLQWHTFLGGTGADYGKSIALDNSGNVYISGSSSVTWGAPVHAYTGGVDAFTAKLDTSGVLQWHTFIGGTGNDYGKGVAVDGNGNVVTSGNSEITWGTPVRAFTEHTIDAFAVSLNGTGSLRWNTFFGGTGNDYGYQVAIDADGNAYAIGESDANWGVPVRAYYGSTYDVFAVKFDTNGALTWNTFLGGSGADYGNGVAVDNSGNVYVAGFSNAAWGTAPVRAYYGSTFDAFAIKLASSGNLTWNTFLGGSGTDFGNAIAVDNGGNVFVSGDSSAGWGDAPVRAHDGASNDACVTRMNSSGNITWNTFLGGSGNDYGYGLAIDGGANVYLTGDSSTTWGDLPVRAFSGSSPDAFAVKMTSGGALIVPEIGVAGNSVSIASGDTVPSADDHTDFGSADILNSSVVRTFTIINTGAAELLLSGDPRVAVGGTDASDFTIIAQPSSPVASGANTTFQVEFDPSVTGNRSATISIANDDYDEYLYTFGICGTGTVAPEIDLEKDGNDIPNGGSYDSGLWGINFPKDVIFTIRNTGSDNLTLALPFTLTGDTDQFSITGNATSPVIPGGNTTFTVRFLPLGTGARSATVNITSNDSDENPYSFTINGTGTLSPEINIRQDATTIPDGGTYNFGTIVNGSSRDVVFTIGNSGSENLSLVVPLTVTGPDADRFSIWSQPAENVTISDTTTFTMRFSAAGVGVKTAAISINNTDLDESSYDLVLVGTVTSPPPPSYPVVPPDLPLEPEPEPEPEPDPEPEPEPVIDIVPVGRVIAEVDTRLPPKAVDSSGNRLVVIGRYITVSDNGSGCRVHFPVILGEGETLQSFTAAGGVAFRENTLTLPPSSMSSGGNTLLRALDESGDLDVTIRIVTGNCTSTDTGASAKVLSITTIVSETVHDFSKENPGLSQVSAGISLELLTLPQDAVIELNTSLEPDPQAAQAFHFAAEKAGLGDISVACAFDVEKTNLVNGRDIKSATVTVSAGIEWVVENGGIDSMRIMRYEPFTGACRELLTRFKGFREDNRAVFESVSPTGCSVFVLAGRKNACVPLISAAPVSKPTPEPVPGTLTDTPLEETFVPENIGQRDSGLSWWSILALIAFIGMEAALFIVWRRSRKSLEQTAPASTGPPEDMVQ